MTRSPTGTIGGRLSEGVADLFPGYFALVMATGIVSIAAHLLQMPRIASVLLAINLCAYAVLSVMFVVRFLVYFPRVLHDLNSHARGPGFFTVVAGTCVLGSEIAILTGRAGAAHALWVAGIVLWVVVMYAFFTATVVRESKPTLETGINGGVAPRHRGDPGRVGPRNPARARDRGRAGGRAVLRAVPVPGRRHAVPDNHHADLLPLHVSSR